MRIPIRCSTIGRRQGRTRGRCTDLPFPISVSLMSEMTLEMTAAQHEILLRGLRYVRSSVALDAMDWDEAVDAERKQQYAAIAEVESLAKQIKVRKEAAV